MQALLTVLLAAVAGPSVTGKAVLSTTDANPAALDRPPMGAFSTTDIGETLWSVALPGDYNVGCTDVQDTLMWASAGQTQLKIYIYRIDPTRALIDSFAQTGGPSGWGIRDMAYKASTDEVFAGFDGSRFHVYNASTHVPNNTYTITGYSGTVRGFGYDVTEDSCWTCNFTTSPMAKFSITGTNGHQVRAAASMGSAYGLARDPGNNCIWYSQAGAAGASPFVKLTYPGYAAVDSFNPTGWDLAGGCEMWRGDTLMLAVHQATPDKVWCLRIGGGAPPVNCDVALAAIDRPAAVMSPASIRPKGTIRNFGTQAASNIPVTCWVDSGATRVYNQSGNYAGTIPPGSSDTFAFTVPWNTGPAGAAYNVTMFASLAGDENRANDTARKDVLISAAVLSETIIVRRVVNDTPNIDGLIEVQEWIPSIEYDISDINARCGVVRPPGSVLVRFLYDSTYLYTAIDVPPVQTRGNYDQAGLYVDENHDHAWASDSSEGNYWIEYVNGDSVMYRSMAGGSARPCPDAFSRSGTVSGHLQFEARIPIGPRRSDLTIEPGDTIGFFEYMAQAPGNVYWGWFPQSLLMAHWADPAYYGHIVLDTAVVGIGSPAPRPALQPRLFCATVAGNAVRVSYSAGTGDDARVTVHDAAGRRVRTLVSGKAEPGHRDAVWDLTDDSGWRVAAGTYFLRLSVSGHAVSARAVALR